MFDVLDFGKYNLYIWLSYSISFTSILIYFIISLITKAFKLSDIKIKY